MLHPILHVCAAQFTKYLYVLLIPVQHPVLRIQGAVKPSYCIVQV